MILVRCDPVVGIVGVATIPRLAGVLSFALALTAFLFALALTDIRDAISVL